MRRERTELVGDEEPAEAARSRFRLLEAGDGAVDAGDVLVGAGGEGGDARLVDAAGTAEGAGEVVGSRTERGRDHRLVVAAVALGEGERSRGDLVIAVASIGGAAVVNDRAELVHTLHRSRLAELDARRALHLGLQNEAVVEASGLGRNGDGR